MVRLFLWRFVLSADETTFARERRETRYPFKAALIDYPLPVSIRLYRRVVSEEPLPIASRTIAQGHPETG